MRLPFTDRHPDRSSRALRAAAEWRDRGADARGHFTAIPPLRGRQKMAAAPVGMT